MKKFLSFFAFAALMLAGCDPIDEPEPQPVDPGTDPVTPVDPTPTDPTPPPVTLYDVIIQLVADGANFTVPGVNVVFEDASGVTSYEAATDDNGAAAFKVPAGSYSASATYKTAEDGKRVAFNGSNSSITVSEAATFQVSLNKVVSQQVIIKELYSFGCGKNDTGNYSDDAYVILYNNSDIEADASDIVFSLILPANGNAANKYIKDGALMYESLGWVPAYSAIWWFTSEVKIPAYSQIVVAIFGAIDHTQTVSASVDLSKPEYYWMSNTEIASVFKNAKYKVSDSISKDHYLNAYPISAGNAWVISNQSPAFYIGKMAQAEAEALSKDADNYDKTATLTVAKFPQDKVVDAVEVWSAANIEKSNYRFPASINTGYVALTNNLGHTVYRNVDKEATEALPENAGKLVYNYSGGSYDAATQKGSTDPSGIDAEASIANGAHIIYSDTNDSGKDFHERLVASLKRR